MSLISLSTSIDSLKAQRRLAESSSRLGYSLERLSSGQRINRASDDAAGLAISNSLSANSRVYNQGIRNVNDGISLLNVAESTLTQGIGIVQRLRELTTQAMNGVYSSAQRSALDTEAFTLTKEYNRLMGTARFNGLNILGGNFGSLQIQGGFGTEGMTSFNIGAGLERNIGSGTFSVSDSNIGNFSSLDEILVDLNNDGKLDHVSLDFPGSTHLYSALGNGDGTFQAANDIAALGGPSGHLVTGDFNGDGYADIAYTDGALVLGYYGTGTGTFSGGLSYAGTNVTALAVADYNGDGRADLVATNTTGLLYYRSSGSFFQAGITIATTSSNASVVSGDFNGDGKIDIAFGGTTHSGILLGNGNGTFGAVSTWGSSVVASYLKGVDINRDGNLDLLTYAGNVLQVALGTGNGTFNTAVTHSITGSSMNVGDMNNDGLLDIITNQRIAYGNGDGTFGAQITINVASKAIGDLNGDGVLDMTSVHAYLSGTFKTTQLQYVSLMSTSLAGSALSVLDQMQNRINSEISMIGAYQSRFQTVINNLQSLDLNTQTANGRILNIDIADESARSVRETILQQVGTAVLAQANNSNAIALLLLRT